MSDDENFLSRWSRRKRELARSDAEAPQQDAAKTATEKPPVEQTAEEPVFDLSKLPSLDSITANSDITAFMQAGVPSSLRHAALRRAWSADPAIRDFVGLSENSWDFTDPNGMVGFGPLDPGTDVSKLVSDLFRDATKPAQMDTEASREQSREQVAAAEPLRADPNLLPRESDAAPQHDADDQPAEHKGIARPHGGAMPR